MKALFSSLAIMIAIASIALGQSTSRLESEYKLSVPSESLIEVWNYLTDRYNNNIHLHLGPTWKAWSTDEKFNDVYFDTRRKNLREQNIGLRYRRRFQGGELIKELIQLKQPSSSDLVRTEEKYEVNTKLLKNQMKSRHAFLKYIKDKDRDRLDFQLSMIGVKSELLRPALYLTQLRKRIYLKDTISAFATFTLDHVANRKFPYQKFSELEIEINEIRYTNSSKTIRNEMDSIVTTFKKNIQLAFPELVQDQSPKYNKMLAITDSSLMSWSYNHWPWLIFCIIMMYGVYSAFGAFGLF